MDLEKNFTSTLDRRTNVSVLEEVKPKRSLEAKILRLKVRYFGHVMRAKGSLERDIMLGKFAGKATDTLARQYQGWYQPTIGSFKRNRTRQEKMAHAGGRKDSE